jgi:glycosyltransferase involved in cell wall biosynthesis
MQKSLTSIIVTAYNRRKYLANAVQSIIDSTLLKDSYELIVVKNFKDEFVDNAVEKLGGRNILADFASIGAKISMGMKVAKGDVIAFLDDDDMYSSIRLEIVANKFQQDPSLIYYHNNVFVVDESNRLIYDSMIERTNIPREVIARNGEEKLNAFELYRWYLGLRLSTIAIRKSFIAKWFNVIKLFPELVDVLIYLLALVDEGAMLHDPRRLTYYRVSGTSASSIRFVGDPAIRFSRAVRNAVRHAFARHELVTLARHLGLSNYVGYDEATVIGCIYSNCGNFLAKVVTGLEDCRSVACLGATILGIIYMLNPTLAKRLIYSYYTRLFNLWG